MKPLPDLVDGAARFRRVPDSEHGHCGDCCFLKSPIGGCNAPTRHPECAKHEARCTFQPANEEARAWLIALKLTS